MKRQGQQKRDGQGMGMGWGSKGQGPRGYSDEATERRSDEGKIGSGVSGLGSRKRKPKTENRKPKKKICGCAATPSRGRLGHSAGWATAGRVRWVWVIWLLAVVGMAGCEEANMREASHVKPYEPTAFFGSDTSARPQIEGTVARGTLRGRDPFFTGEVDGQPLEALPMPVTLELLRRGQERFNVFCSPCHGMDGYGQGMIVQRGFSQPPSYHIDRLREAPPGHFFGVMTKGLGRMPSYAVQVPPADRWAIAAYVKALQVSQHATLNDLPAEARQELEAMEP